MRTIELQAEVFTRDYSIKHKDLQLLRMSQHRSLCDTLIYQQRRLIQGETNRLFIGETSYLILFSRKQNSRSFGSGRTLSTLFARYRRRSTHS